MRRRLAIHTATLAWPVAGGRLPLPPCFPRRGAKARSARRRASPGPSPRSSPRRGEEAEVCGLVPCEPRPLTSILSPQGRGGGGVRPCSARATAPHLDPLPGGERRRWRAALFRASHGPSPRSSPRRGEEAGRAALFRASHGPSPQSSPGGERRRRHAALFRASHGPSPRSSPRRGEEAKACGPVPCEPRPLTSILSPEGRGGEGVRFAHGFYSTTTGILPIFVRHSFGPVWCTEVPALSTATVTGMSFTSNS